MSPEDGKPAAENSVLFRGVPSDLRLFAAEKLALRDFAAALSQKVADGRPFTCLVTNDRALRKLNRIFLQHDYPTDVLSFPAARNGGSGDLGEVAISIERAAEQAAGFGHSCFDEMRILMLHGVLHLTGMDHERDHGEMARVERKWRKALDLPPTLLARLEAGRGARAR